MSATTTKNPSLGNAQLRLLEVIEALAGNEVFGLRLKDVATAVKTPLPTVLRDLQTLAEKGWAVQDDAGKWRLGPKPVQISNAFTWGIASARRKVDETEQRYTREP